MVLPPTFSIVIPAFRSARWIGQTVASVRAQTRTDWECVVVDDGSDDATADAARRASDGDQRITVVTRPNGGVSAARNTGIERSNRESQFFAFLDSDDVWAPHALAVMAGILERRPDAVGVTVNARRVDERGCPVDIGVHEARVRGRLRVSGLRLRLVPRHDDTDFATLTVAGRVWPMGVGLFRAARVREVSGFDETLVIGEDWDFLIRLTRSGPLVFHDEVLVDYRQHPGSLTAQDQDRTVLFLDRVRHKAWTDPANSPRQRAQVAAGWRAVTLAAVIDTARRAAGAVARGDWGATKDFARTARALTATVISAGPPEAHPGTGYRRRPMVAAVVQRASRGETLHSRRSRY